MNWFPDFFRVSELPWPLVTLLHLKFNFYRQFNEQNKWLEYLCQIVQQCGQMDFVRRNCIIQVIKHKPQQTQQTQAIHIPEEETRLRIYLP